MIYEDMNLRYAVPRSQGMDFADLTARIKNCNYFSTIIRLSPDGGDIPK
jgi:hypothetical protein